MKAMSFLLGVLFCLSSSVRADRVDDFINSEMAKLHVPGLSILVMRHGGDLKRAGYGSANLELDVPATSETVYELGAISGQFTAAGILLLRDEGKLSLDDPVGKYLRQLPSSWSNITIRHCLSHTTGITNYTYTEGFEMRQKLTQEKFIRMLGAYPLEFEPGTKWYYSPADYAVLGYIIANVSGQSYWNFLDQRILSPLNMNSTMSRGLSKVVRNRANGYFYDKSGDFMNRDSDLTDFFAAAGTMSTVADMAKWDAALNSNRLLSESSRALLWTPVKLDNGNAVNNGYCFLVSQHHGAKELSLVGGAGGFTSCYLRYPDRSLSVIVMVNLAEINSAPTIARGVAGMYLAEH